MIGRFLEKLFSKRRFALASLVAAASCVAVALACSEFGFVFNFTHSAPFGIYRRPAKPTAEFTRAHPMHSFVPISDGQVFRNNPNTRRESGHLSRWLCRAPETRLSPGRATL